MSSNDKKMIKSKKNDLDEETSLVVVQDKETQKTPMSGMVVVCIFLFLMLIVVLAMFYQMNQTLNYISYDMMLIRERTTGVKDYPKEMVDHNKKMEESIKKLTRSASKYVNSDLI